MAAFKDHFSKESASYARHRPTYPRALVDFFAEAAPSTDVAWDVGCGSGQLSVVLAQRFAIVHATDASAQQIAHAVPHRSVRYHVAHAERSELDPRSADLVVAAQAVHWFDLDAFYLEVERVARDGALVALVSYFGPLDLPGRAADVMADFYWKTLDGHWPPERSLVETEYRSLPFPFEPVPAPRFQLEVDWSIEGLLAYVRTWSAVASLDRAGKLGELADFERALRDAWPTDAPTQRLSFPLGLRLGRVRTGRPSPRRG